jgi:hypothetical protein
MTARTPTRTRLDTDVEHVLINTVDKDGQKPW